jgi:eukaryotic-like serine/threonine-protein kinase
LASIRFSLVVFLQRTTLMTAVMSSVGPHRAKELLSGETVDGRYRVVRKLADGGMGTVFLAEHILIKRRVAIKVLHAELAADRGMLERFMNEAAAAGTLGHPHIVESTDMGFTRDGVPYIVFEYLEGCLLSEEIGRLGRLPVRRALVVARQIASALEAAHNARIAHLDLKSNNVFLTDRGDAADHAKLLDFGISRFMAADPQITQPNMLMGTPTFMAPEQVMTPDQVDCRADIYALGVLLYEMLTGRCPFVSADAHWVLARIIHDHPPPLDRPVPAMLEHLLFDGLLVKSRESRLQTMGEVMAILDVLIATLRSGVPEALQTFDELEQASTARRVRIIEPRRRARGTEDARSAPAERPSSNATERALPYLPLRRHGQGQARGQGEGQREDEGEGQREGQREGSSAPNPRGTDLGIEPHPRRTR